MIVIVGGRQSGKSEAVLRWLMEHPGQRGVVVLDIDRKRHLLHRLHDHMPSFPWAQHIITVGDAMNARGYGGHFGQAPGPWPEMAIDDAEDVMSRLFGARVEFAAMNGTYIPLGPVPQNTIKADATVTSELASEPHVVINQAPPNLRMVKGGLDDDERGKSRRGFDV